MSATVKGKGKTSHASQNRLSLSLSVQAVPWIHLIENQYPPSIPYRTMHALVSSFQHKLLLLQTLPQQELYVTPSRTFKTTANFDITTRMALNVVFYTRAINRHSLFRILNDPMNSIPVLTYKANGHILNNKGDIRTTDFMCTWMHVQ